MQWTWIPCLILGACSSATVDSNLIRLGTLAQDPLPHWVRVLGTAQDAGKPQLNCQRPCCADWLAGGRRARVASLGLVADQSWVLVDAGPDVVEQIHLMGSMPAAVLLTHAHMGHYTGLAHFGREAAATKRLPVWCTPRMANFLRQQGPWSQLVALQQIELHEITQGVAFAPAPGLKVQALWVPHRDEFSDTVAFSIQREGARVLYAPDIDHWGNEGNFLLPLAETHDHLLLDGTFYADGELSGRTLAEVPHPRVKSTMDLLEPLVQGGRTQVSFLHLNHTNPLWNRNSPESIDLARRGFRLATAVDARHIPFLQGNWEQPLRQLIFFAILEGLYLDGISSEVAAAFAQIQEDTKLPAHFVYSCPLCMPTFDALRLYLTRPSFYSNKLQANTFGAGLSSQQNHMVLEGNRQDLMKVLETLVSRWIGQRLDSLDLSPQERLDIKMKIGMMRKKGMSALHSFQEAGGVKSQHYADWEDCAVCEGSWAASFGATSP